MYKALISALAVIPVLTAMAQSPAEELEKLALDYAHDPALIQPAIFGIRIDGQDWTIVAKPESDKSQASVTVTEGAPDVPAFVYVTDNETFGKIAAGKLHALTAMAQANSSDPAPMTLDIVNGWKMDDAGRNAFLGISFHFFTTGAPEVVPLGPEYSLTVHGGEALPIYYADQLRTSWYGIAPGQHINADPADQVNDFPSLYIIIKAGTARSRLGGKEFMLNDNQAILVPAGLSHEFWNPGEERATLILIMFGENA